MTMYQTYKPGDHVRNTVEGRLDDDTPIPVGTHGVVVDIEGKLFLDKNPVDQFVLDAAVRRTYDLAVKWDGCPPDLAGHDFYMQFDDEVEPA